jgi:hypothetical protein
MSTSRRTHGIAGALLLALLLGSTARADTIGLPPCTPFDHQWKLDRAAGKARVLAVRAVADWRRLWAGLGRKAPDVDFERQTVVGVIAAPGEKRVIYRVQIDDPAAPKRLEVRVADRAAFCDTRDGPPGARVHLVAVPRSALPVWFVRDQMVDGGVFGVHNEGTDELELGRAAAGPRPSARRPVVLREDAERLAYAALDAKERAKIQQGPLGGPMRRVLHPWVPLRVERQAARWRVRYGALDLWVDTATGAVSRR